MTLRRVLKSIPILFFFPSPLAPIPSSLFPSPSSPLPYLFLGPPTSTSVSANLFATLLLCPWLSLRLSSPPRESDKKSRSRTHLDEGGEEMKEEGQEEEVGSVAEDAALSARGSRGKEWREAWSCYCCWAEQMPGTVHTGMGKSTSAPAAPPSRREKLVPPLSLRPSRAPSPFPPRPAHPQRVHL